jgi:GMP synthase (glutamine-hydrolysing)
VGVAGDQYARRVTLRFLVIQHEDECPPEWFGQWWEEVGVELDVVLAHTGAAVPRDLGEHDALVVLGGEMGANDDETHRWLTPTKRLIRTVIEDDQPFLGICLGHQLAAAALGGLVEVNACGHATGLTLVSLTADGLADPLLGPVPQGSEAIQWNNDVVTRLPEGATRLATAPDGTVQAARWGARAWGVQFHPETSAAQFRSWTVDKSSAAIPREDGVDVFATSAAVDAAQERLRTNWRPLAVRFAGLAATRLEAEPAAGGS